VLNYAGTGTCHINDGSSAGCRRIEVVVEDHGPGIANIDLALTDGYSTGGGLGAGLPATRRLMHEFAIESRAGWTQVRIAMLRRTE
jgi:serine/threonine-protein kinase RsbT